MAKTKISEFSATPGNNTDIDSINIAEGCAPSGINDAIRELMAQLKDFQTGAVGDSFNGPVGTTTAAAGAFTTLAASSTVTLSGGTANGVTYLNGSKVLTSGSALVFDGSNLGLGVTPSAWASNRRTLEIGGNIVSNLALSSAISEIYVNTVWNGSSNNYKNNGPASWWNFNNQSSGGWAFSIAPSGTAGAAISFTQAMTLAASGNLGVGTTSPIPSARLQVKTATNINFAIQTGTADATGVKLNAFNDAASVNIPLELNGSVLLLKTGETERARIDSSGNLLAGTTSTLGGSGTGLIQSVTTGGLSNLWLRRGTDYGGVAQFQNFGGSTVGSISVSASATAYNTSSDYRLKEDIAPMTGALAKVALLKPVTYKWKVDGSDGQGFIAHELAEVCPQAVTGDKDAVDEEGKPQYQGIDVSFLVGTLTAAIQEQQALILTLQADVAALKAAA